MFLSPPLQADPVNRTFLLGTIRTLSFGGDRLQPRLANRPDVCYIEVSIPLGGSGRSTFRAAWTNQNMSRTSGKKYTAASSQVERRPYPIEEAVPLVQKVKYAKFDETVE